MSALTVSVSPHIRGGATTQGLMRDVLIALVPALIASVVIFGARALLIVAVCVAACVVCEWGYEKLLKRKNTVRDLSACITGVLLAFNLPVGIPVWQAIFGSAVAIILVKQLFGGVGKNFANPAITARIVMLLAFASTMTTWVIPDGVTGATPLVLLGRGELGALPPLRDMLLGVRGGCLGETSVLALALGGAYLLVRRVVTWHTPIVYVATVFAFTWILGRDAVYYTLSGGLILGAFFMATDYVTTPQTAWGRVVFGFGAGFFTVVIRLYGSYPEGVSYSILLMNILTPYINRLTMRRALGGIKA
ncbi:MAG: RnfABCDGE type electron transport complex subunit D [Oscillospiraceae bacterium]|jgi:electron transport complex protein RnfD|nr:RnfABCDGE type electron transport complex subunit D [Oscillospiraceae bacterium]